MGKVKNGSGWEGFYQGGSHSTSSYNQRSAVPKRNFTWRREPITRDHTKGFAIDPTTSSIVTDPAPRDLVARPRDSYRLQSRRLRPHDSVPPVFYPYVYGAYGDPSYRYGAQAYPSHDFRAHYPPSHGSGACGPPFHGVGAPGPPYRGIRDPGPLSHRVAACSLPSYGFGVHGSPSCGDEAITPSPKFPAVSMRGVPSNCREVDIIRFFDGLHVVDVFISKTFPGEAFVVFPSSVVAHYALRRDKQKLGDVPVEIFTCRRQDYYDAVASGTSGVDFGNPRAQAKSSDYVVKHTHDNAVGDSKLHGHSEAKANCLVRDKEVNRTHPDGKPAGDVLVEFISQDDAKKAMSKAENMIGSYSIEILPLTVRDLPATNIEWRRERDCRDRVKESSSKELTVTEPVAYSHGKPKRSSDKERKEYTQTLKLRNVPPSADMYDIIEFFGEFNLTLDRLQVVCHRDGIATGEVYVEFDSVEDAKKAMSKDKKKILSEHVQLFPSSPNEASRAVARFR